MEACSLGTVSANILQEAVVANNPSVDVRSFQVWCLHRNLCLL